MLRKTITLSLMDITLVRFLFPLNSIQATVVKSIYTGRDKLVAKAVGTTSFGGVTYSTTAKNIADLIAAGSTGCVSEAFDNLLQKYLLSDYASF